MATSSSGDTDVARPHGNSNYLGDPNRRDNLGRTPLHFASYYSDREAAEALLDAGADINALDNNGRSPLVYALHGSFDRKSVVYSAFSLMSELCSQTWMQLAAAHETDLSIGEETITDLLCLVLKSAGVPDVQVHKINRRVEAETGVDIEMYVGNEDDGWWTYFIQAKRIEVVPRRYLQALHARRRDGALQIDLLEKDAKAKGAIPLYALYNYVDIPDVKSHNHCRLSRDAPLLGWSVARLETVREFVDKRQIPLFEELHKEHSTVPARCLLCPHLSRNQSTPDHLLAGKTVVAKRRKVLPGHIKPVKGIEEAFQSQGHGRWAIVFDDSFWPPVICPGRENQPAPIKPGPSKKKSVTKKPSKSKPKRQAGVPKAKKRKPDIRQKKRLGS